MKTGILNKLKNFLLPILIVVTFYILLKEEDLSSISSGLKSMLPVFLIPAFLFAFFRFVGEAITLQKLLSSQGYKRRWSQCLKYTIAGFFYSAVTPSASGGQPAQLLYMSEDDIHVGEGSLVLIIQTILYRGVLLLLAVGAYLYLVFCCNKDFGYGRLFIYYGIGIHILLVLFYCGVLFFQKQIHKWIQWFIFKLWKVRWLKRPYKIWIFWNKIKNKYEAGSKYIVQHKKFLLKLFLLLIAQRIGMVMVTYWIYLSFGFSSMDFLQIISLQLMVSLGSDLLPLPGGVGANEKLYLMFFKDMFIGSTLMPSLLISRGISFYFLLVVSSFLILYFQYKHKKELQ